MVTVIMTIWKRQNALEQIKALLSQTVKPTKIWIYHCGNHVNVDLGLLEYSSIIEYQFNTGDLGYFGRFSLATLARTDYLYLLDDDVIPTPNWVETCLNLCNELNSIVSSSGRIIPEGNFFPEIVKNKDHLKSTFIGDSDSSSLTNICLKNTYVDYGCNSWFLKTEWLQHFWGSQASTFLTGEDIHLSASCNVKGGIKTIVPFQDGVETCGNLKKTYGWDEYASWKRPNFYELRQGVLKYWIETNQWMLINSTL